jgi:negative regulator of sigma E activity
MVSEQGGPKRPDVDCREALSSLIDGELDEAECRRLLERLCREEQVQREWTLLNVACDALRSSEVAALHSERFVARVRHALAAEPAIVAPPPRARANRFVRRRLLPAAAVAAAVAVLGVVAVPHLRGPTLPATAVAQKASAAPAATIAVAAPATTVQAEGIVRSAELEAYLEAHREQATGPLLPRPNAYQRASATLAPQPR